MMITEIDYGNRLLMVVEAPRSRQKRCYLYPIYKACLLFVLLFATLFSVVAEAQVIKDFSDADLEVYYNKYVVLDTLQADSRHRETKMALRIGGGHALFAAPRNMWVDSLLVYNFDMYMDLYMKLNPIGGPGEWTPLSTYEHEYLFKNMPDGKNTTFRSFGLDNYVYEEVIEPQEWVLGDGVRTILGYECRMAECDYRGRHWIAWYAPEISVPEGPWKLGGLPGLILEAYDSRRHYVFTALGMTTDVPGKVGIHIFDAGDLTTTTRAEYLQFKWRRVNKYEDRSVKLRAAGIIKTPKRKKEPVKMIYNHYDFEETDYPHKM